MEDLAAGAPVRVEGPAGTLRLPEARDAAPLLFVAGGTGIAPFRSMIREALQTGYGGPLSLVYSARTPDEFAYLAELRDLAQQGRLALTLTLTGESGDWVHARGRAGAAHLAELVRPGTVAFVCGPPSMVADLPAALDRMGLDAARVRTERW